MPAEARYILFSLDETEGVVRRFGHARGLELPYGPLRRVEDAGNGFRFVFQCNDGRRADVELSASVVVAAALLDCRHQRLPIPRNALKRVEAMGDGLALVATYDCFAAPTTTVVNCAEAAAKAS